MKGSNRSRQVFANVTLFAAIALGAAHLECSSSEGASQAGGAGGISSDASANGTGGVAGGDGAGSGGTGGTVACTPAACDDGFACTIDSCSAGKCAHTIGPTTGATACAAGKYCSVSDGCVASPACATTVQCEALWAMDACKANPTCDPATSLCLFTLLDKDGDGHAPQVYGGDDCDDSNNVVYPGAAEICDGEDNNCDGVIDNAAACPSGESCVSGACTVGGQISLCDAYCTAVMKNCTGAQAVYRTSSACLTACAPLTQGTTQDTRGGTVGCRLFYAGLAGANSDAVANCYNAAGKGLCADTSGTGGSGGSGGTSSISGTGSASGAGMATGSGGGTGAGGTSGAGGTGNGGTTGGGCLATEKFCSGKCVAQNDPAYGCSAAACLPACNIPNGDAQCVGGQCAVAGCFSKPPYGDCNGLASDGCEADLFTDAKNCGSCGHACAQSQTCDTGSCVP